MSTHVPYPSRSQETLYIGPPTRVNGLGIAGFIVSLVGLLFTCGVLCPLGVMLSLIGLLHKPRGFAIAGTLIGIAGSAFLALVGWGLVMGFLGARDAINSGVEVATTFAALSQADQRIQIYRAEHEGQLPEGIEGNKLILDLNDAWNKTLRYDVDGDTYLIRSAGRDSKFETPDDLVQKPSANPSPQTVPNDFEKHDGIDKQPRPERSSRDR